LFSFIVKKRLLVYLIRNKKKKERFFYNKFKGSANEDFRNLHKPPFARFESVLIETSSLFPSLRNPRVFVLVLPVFLIPQKSFQKRKSQFSELFPDLSRTFQLENVVLGLFESK